MYTSICSDQNVRIAGRPPSVREMINIADRFQAIAKDISCCSIDDANVA